MLDLRQVQTFVEQRAVGQSSKSVMLRAVGQLVVQPPPFQSQRGNIAPQAELRAGGSARALVVPEEGGDGAGGGAVHQMGAEQNPRKRAWCCESMNFAQDGSPEKSLAGPASERKATERTSTRPKASIQWLGMAGATQTRAPGGSSSRIAQTAPSQWTATASAICRTIGPTGSSRAMSSTIRLLSQVQRFGRARLPQRVAGGLMRGLQLNRLGGQS